MFISQLHSDYFLVFLHFSLLLLTKMHLLFKYYFYLRLLGLHFRDKMKWEGKEISW